MKFKDPMNNMDFYAVRVVHVLASNESYVCGRHIRATMWGMQDVLAGKMPTCVACVAGVSQYSWRDLL